jgi:tetratricopeptide (TPR) repeat protein
MELWEQAEECHLRAIETKEGDKQIELLDKTIYLYLQATEQAETEKIRLIRIGNARMVEANKYTALANKLASKAKASSRGVQVECIREAASYQLSAYTSRKEAAEIAKEQGDVAAYRGRIGSAYSDQAVYHFYLAGASAVVSNWDEALSGFKESLSLFENALEHYNRSLRIEFTQHAEDNRKQCLGYIENCRSGIQLAESMITDIKTTGTPSLSVNVAADNLRQNTYSPVMLKLVNNGDGVAKDVKIRLDAPVEGETTASLETMSEEYETGLALSVKPLEHGRMKFKIYVEYRDMHGRRDTATGEAWMQVARLEQDKQVAGGDIVGGSKTGDVGVLKGGIGAAEKAFSNCPHCGEALNLPKTPKFCPYCGAELRQEK